MAWMALACGALACGGDEVVSIELGRVAPAADPLCGAPADAQTLVITALGDFSAAQGRAVSHGIGEAGDVEIGALPAATRVLAVEVLGEGGAVRAIGKTAPFDLNALDSDDSLAVFMAPPRGLCPTGPPALARARPLVARIGPGALIGGGTGAQGEPVIPIEYYDPGTGDFAIAIDEHYGTGEHGLIGASMTSLGSEVVIAGGGVPAYQIYDGDTGALSAALFLDPGRAFRAAIALDDGRVLVAGGCSPLDANHQCMPASALRSTSIIEVSGAGNGGADHNQVRPGPALLAARIGGVAVRESETTVLLIGGIDDTGAAVDTIERVRLDGGASELIAKRGGAGATLAAGGALVAFAPDNDSTPGAEAAVLPPGAGAAVDVARAPWPMVGATMTALEDGRVLVVGAQAGGAGRVLVYEPNRAGFQALPVAGPGRDHGAVRLDDGSVLVVGGRARDLASEPPRASAWIIRPDLTGPFASDVVISFGDVELSQNLVPRDPSMTALVPGSGSAPAYYRLDSSGIGGGLPSGWAVIAGPVFTRVEVRARARSLGGGLALLFGFAGADSHVSAVFVAGQPATVYRVEAGTPRVIAPCTAEVITIGDLMPPGDESADIELDLEPTSLRARIGAREVLSCAGLEPLPAGLVGVGVVGQSGTALRIDYLSASR